MPIFMMTQAPLNIAVLYMANKDQPALMTFEENPGMLPVMESLSGLGAVVGEDIDVALQL